MAGLHGLNSVPSGADGVRLEIPLLVGPELGGESGLVGEIGERHRMLLVASF